MYLKFKLYIKYIYETAKEPTKYFGIWLLTGTWLPWLAWKSVFTDQGHDGVLRFIEYFILFLLSTISVVTTLLAYHGVIVFYKLTIGFYKLTRDYFKSLSYRVESEIYKQNHPIITRRARMVDNHMEDVLPVKQILGPDADAAGEALGRLLRGEVDSLLNHRRAGSGHNQKTKQISISGIYFVPP